MTLRMTQPNIIFSKPLYNRKETNRIMIHHSVSDPTTTAERIHQWHLDKGWSGIGYNYVVLGSGEIQTGRPIDKIGAHTYDYNGDSIGVCLSGNFMVSTPTEAQLVSLVALIRYIESVYKKKLLVQRHRDLNPTACPGDLFPWDNLLQRLQTVEPDASLIQRALDNHLITQVHDLTEVANKEFVLLTELNLLEEMRRNK